MREGDYRTEETQPGGMTVEPRHLWRAEPGTHGIPLFDLATGVGPLRRGAVVSHPHRFAGCVGNLDLNTQSFTSGLLGPSSG